MASEQDGIESKRRIWAILSIALAIISLGCKYLYGKWHTRLFEAQYQGQQLPSPTWMQVGMIDLASAVGALVALVLAAFAYRLGPRRLGFVALLLAIVACMMIPLRL